MFRDGKRFKIEILSGYVLSNWQSGNQMAKFVLSATSSWVQREMLQGGWHVAGEAKDDGMSYQNIFDRTRLGLFTTGYW